MPMPKNFIINVCQVFFLYILCFLTFVFEFSFLFFACCCGANRISRGRGVRTRGGARTRGGGRTRAGAPLRGGVRVRGGGSFRGERGASAVGRGTARPSLSAL